jgi:ABC-type nitrate/sulfonate/bicarbonate transport system substrate-binding protein
MMRWVSVLGLVLSLAACTGGGAPVVPPPDRASAPVAATPSAASTPAPDRVVVGYLKAGAEAGLLIAAARGYFDEQRLALELEQMSADKAAPLLATGQVDLHMGGVTAGLFNAVARGIPLKVVADRGHYAPGRGYNPLVLRKGLLERGEVQTLRDLQGRAVAIPGPGIPSEVELGTALASVGLGFADVDLKTLAFPDMVAALANETIDAAMLIEPFATQGKNRGILDIWMTTDRIIPDHEPGIVTYSAQFAARTDPARRFMVAYVRGLRDYLAAFSPERRDQEQVIQIMAEGTGIADLQLWREMILPDFDPDGRVNVASLKADQDWYAANGEIPTKIDVDRLVDHAFVEYAVQQLGSAR